MIKDFNFKLLFIPLFGICIPALSGLVYYSNFKLLQVVSSNLFFILCWYLTWQGTVNFIARVRNNKYLLHTLHKLLLLCSVAFLIAALLSATSALIWEQAWLPILNQKAIIDYGLNSGLLMVFIILIYEILFLKKEVELDTQIVDQLDLDRQHAELNVLSNELDPHFIFNSLTSLTHLINNNTEKASLFTQKLAQSYKYLLVHKNHEMISLAEELRFIDDYFFLLQIRHDHKLQLTIDLDENRCSRYLVLPCAVQILIENAIKHNQFSEAAPLNICISMNNRFLKISNNVSVKPYLVESTNIGLKNLQKRYKITCKKDILIYRIREKFVVNLPLIPKPSNQYEKSNYN